MLAMLVVFFSTVTPLSARFDACWYATCHRCVSEGADSWKWRAHSQHLEHDFGCFDSANDLCVPSYPMPSSDPEARPEAPQNSTQPGNQNERRIRSRAPQACVACRARKVRCDYLERQPCTRCRVGRRECQAPPAPVILSQYVA